MARLTRVEVFVADDIALGHVMNRTMRRCFLLGDDPFSGTTYLTTVGCGSIPS